MEDFVFWIYKTIKREMRLTDMFVLSCVNERELRVLCLLMQSIFELIYDVHRYIHSFDVLECAIDVIVRLILQI